MHGYCPLRFKREIEKGSDFKLRNSLFILCGKFPLSYEVASLPPFPLRLKESMIMEAASNIGESYIALRENSFKLRSSFLTALTGNFFRYAVNTLTLYYITTIKLSLNETNPAGHLLPFIYPMYTCTSKKTGYPGKAKNGDRLGESAA
jgi:hypothetical protein